MHDSRPLDLDRVAQNGSGLDLIWRADSGSGGQGWVGARDGGAGHRSPLLRGGATRGSPDLAKSGRPGVKSTRSWVGWTPRIMRDPLGGFPGFGEALQGLAMAPGGASSPASGVVRAGTRYGLH